MQFRCKGALCASVLLIVLVLGAGSVYAANPAVVIVNPNGAEILIADYNIDFNVSDSDNDNLAVKILYNTSGIPAIGTKITETSDLKGSGMCEDTNFEDSTACRWPWNVDLIAEGINYYVTITVDDGFQNADISDATFIIDNNAPTSSNHTPAIGGWSNNANQQISVTLSDGGSGVKESSIVLNVEGIDYTITPGGKLSYNSGTGLLTFDPSVAPSITFTSGQVVNVSLAVSDNASNWLMPPAEGASWSFTIDTTKPGAAIEEENPSWNTGDSLSISCNDSDSGCADTYWYYFNDNPGVNDCSDNKADYDYNAGLSGTNPKTAALLVNSDANSYLCLWVEDNAGNFGKDVSATLRVDVTAPVTASDAPAGWQTVAPVNVTLTCTDPGYIDGSGDENGSGCANTYYQVDTDAGADVTWPAIWLVYAAPIAFAGDGNFGLQFYSEDNAGNIEDVNMQYVAVDATAPVNGSITIDDNGGYTLDPTPPLILYAEDPTSGVANMRFSCNDDGDWDADVPYSATYGGFDVTAGNDCVAGEGPKTIYVQFQDTAGNWITPPSPSDSTVYDITPPTTTDDLACPAVWQAAPFTITLTVVDNLSPTITYYTTDGTDPDGNSAFGTSILINADGDYVIKYISVDQPGNIETSVKTAACNAQLDTMPPVTTSDANSTWQNFDANVHLTCTDAGSGCALTQFRRDLNAENDVNFYLGWEIWSDGNGIVFSTDGNWALDFNSQDNAAPPHTEATNTSYVLIDKTSPAVTISSPANGSTLGSSTVTVAYTGSDATSGVSYYEVQADSGGWINNGTATSYAFAAQPDGSHTYAVRVYDFAGNSAEAAITVTVSTGGGGEPAGGTGSTGGIGGGGGGGGSDCTDTLNCTGPWCNRRLAGVFESGFLCGEGYVCPQPETTWWDPNTGWTGTCCRTQCEESMITTAPPECAESRGVACGGDEICDGELVEASDTSACCVGACEPKAGTGFNCVESGCDDDNPCTVDECNETSGFCGHSIVTNGFPCGAGRECQNGRCVAIEIVSGGLGAAATPTGLAIFSPANALAGLLALALLTMIYATWRRRRQSDEEVDGAAETVLDTGLAGEGGLGEGEDDYFSLE